MARILRVTSRVAIPESELRFRFSRSSGPGGQHVNKASTRVELMFNLTESNSLTEGEKTRLTRALGRWLDADGTIRIIEEGSRSQWSNRKRAATKLVEMLRMGLKVRKRRLPTRPSKKAREKRLEQKKRRGQVKKMRSGPEE
ncbi:MAG: alternative ribosome rescue aminoacyl-tRNA hydrolase ArfB [Bacteroidota bacterium]